MRGMVLAGIVLLATNAYAQSPLLEKARAQVEDFELQKALELLELMLQDAGLAEDDRVAGLALKASILVGYGCDARAIETYHALIALRPEFRLPPNESPKVRECFEFSRETKPTATAAQPAESAAEVPLQATEPMPEVTEADAGLPTWGWIAIGVGVAALIGGGIALGVTSSQPGMVEGNLGAISW